MRAFSLVAFAAAAMTAEAATFPWTELLTMDCNGGVHLFPNTGIEMHANLTGLYKLSELFADEVKSATRCFANAGGNGCNAALSDEVIDSLVFPSVRMIFNTLLVEPASRVTYPAQCDVKGAQHFAHAVTNQLSTLLIGAFKNPTAGGIAYVSPPSTCTLSSYMTGNGCAFRMTERFSKTVFSFAAKKCTNQPGRMLPYITIFADGGPWRNFAGRPCNSDTDCGRSDAIAAGVAPLVCRDITPDIWNFLGDQNTVYGPTNFTGCAGTNGLTGSDYMVYLARAKINEVLGLPAPSVAGTQRIGFCSLSDQTAKDFASNLTDVTLKSTSTAMTSPDIEACRSKGCNFDRLGNGRCDLSCMNAECNWDAGDCGGAGRFRNASGPVNKMPDSEFFINITSVPVVDRPYINIWTSCNGFHTSEQYIDGILVGKYCNCRYGDYPPECRLSGYNPYDNEWQGGHFCQYIKANCTNLYASCKNFTSGTFYYPTDGKGCAPGLLRLYSLESQLSTWNGVTTGGIDVFSPERVAGIWETPQARFPVAGLPSNIRWLAGIGCSGEVSMYLNSYLNFAFQTPLLQHLTSFASNWLKEADKCYASATGRGWPVLNAYQHEIRRNIHHPASLLYSFTAFPERTLAAKYGSNLLGLGYYAGKSFVIGDPEPWDMVYRNENATEMAMLRALPYAENSRMQPMPSCNLDTALNFGDRRCRASYTGANSLLGDSTGPLLNVHIEAKLDDCANAQISSEGFRMSQAMAADGLPTVGLGLEGIITSLFDGLTPCNIDLECTGTGTSTCVDIDQDIIGGFDDLFSETLYNNFFGMYAGGDYSNGDFACTRVSDFKSSVRRIILRMSGKPVDNSNSLKFCMFNVQGVSDRFSSWSDSAFTQCSRDPVITGDYDTTRQVCMNFPASAPLNASSASSVNGLENYIPWTTRLAPIAGEGMYTGAVAASPSPSPAPADASPSSSPSRTPSQTPSRTASRTASPSPKPVTVIYQIDNAPANLTNPAVQQDFASEIMQGINKTYAVNGVTVTPTGTGSYVVTITLSGSNATAPANPNFNSDIVAGIKDAAYDAIGSAGADAIVITPTASGGGNKEDDSSINLPLVIGASAGGLAALVGIGLIAKSVHAKRARRKKLGMSRVYAVANPYQNHGTELI